MALFVLVICIAFMVFDCIKNHFPIRSLSGGVVILLLLLPLLHYNYRMIGYPVPEVRHAVVIKRIIERSPRLSFLRNPEPVIEIDIEMQNGGGDNE